MNKFCAGSLLLALTVLLAGCGGGGGGGGFRIGAPDRGGSEVPSSAQQGIEGLIAYMKDLIGSRTDETGEPVVLGDAVLPTSETSEPLPVN